MSRILLIGCGKIGALYDFEKEEFLTYAHALSRHKNADITICDQKKEIQQQIAERYHYKTIEDPLSIHFSSYDIVCIATPTTTHFSYLHKALKEGVPVIICEKPLTYKLEDIDPLKIAYNEGNSRVLVNYIRRFQPAYLELQSILRLQLQQDQIKSAHIHYKRGLLNNASHALDLIGFLTGILLTTQRCAMNNYEFDVFSQDPTVSCILRQPDFDIELTGHAFADYPVFDISIIMNFCTVKISNAGDDWSIEYHDSQSEKNTKRSGAIRNYMLAVIELAENILKDPMINDNFAESLELNRQLLQLVKEQTHG